MCFPSIYATKERCAWLLWFMCAVWVGFADQNVTRAKELTKDLFCHTIPLFVSYAVFMNIQIVS